jgi:hypothetical protein
MTDSSLIGGEPSRLELARVIPGWTEGLQLMKIGGNMRLWIPGHLAYDGIPARPQGMLVFDIELLEVEGLPSPPPVPEDVAAPPSSAKKTKRGVFYKVLKPGTVTAEERVIGSFITGTKLVKRGIGVLERGSNVEPVIRHVGQNFTTWYPVVFTSIGPQLNEASETLL